MEETNKKFRSKELKMTILYVVKNGKLLLGLKKKSFGQGKFNGVGGKLEGRETIEKAMLREAKEEMNIKPKNYKLMATIYLDEFIYGAKSRVILYVYLAKDYDGTPVESDEMAPYWFDIDALPYENMIASDKVWLPLVLKEEKFEAYINLDENFNVIFHKIDIFKQNKPNRPKTRFL